MLNIQTPVKQFLALFMLGILSTVAWSNPCNEIIDDHGPVSLLYVESVTPQHRQTLHQEIEYLKFLASEPFSVASYLMRDQKLTVEKYNAEMDKFEALIHEWSLHPNLSNADHISDWVYSDAHAVLFNEVMTKLNFAKYQIDELFESVAQINPFLFDKRRSGPGALGRLTYSYEKEGALPVIANYYKAPKASDDQWFAMSSDERYFFLKSIAFRSRQTFTGKEIAPTANLPSYFGPFQREGGSDFTWEITHPIYELSPGRLISQMKSIAAITGQNRGFHVHLVFEIEMPYRHVEQMAVWLKHFTDYIVLAGIEDGMHPDGVTSPPPTWQSFMSLPIDGAKVLRLAKLHSVGVRDEIYGRAMQSKRMKIGLELRDSFKNIEKYREVLEKLGASIENRVWEHVDTSLFSTRTPQLYNHTREEATALENKIAAILPSAHIWLLNDEIFVPLQKFEEGQYLNFATGKFEGPTTAQKKRIVAAREEFLASLLDLARQVKEQGATPEDIDLLIKLEVNSWSRKARVSELYERF